MQAKKRFFETGQLQIYSIIVVCLHKAHSYKILLVDGAMNVKISMERL